MIKIPSKLGIDIALDAYWENAAVERSRYVNLLMSKDNEQTNADFRIFIQKYLFWSNVHVVAERVDCNDIDCS